MRKIRQGARIKTCAEIRTTHLTARHAMQNVATVVAAFKNTRARSPTVRNKKQHKKNMSEQPDADDGSLEWTDNPMSAAFDLSALATSNNTNCGDELSIGLDLYKLAAEVLYKPDEDALSHVSDEALEGPPVDHAIGEREARPPTELWKGMRVEARYGGGTAYYYGTIVRVRAEGTSGATYDVLYDEGDKEFKVPRDLICPIVAQQTHIPKEAICTSKKRRRSNVTYSGVVSLWGQGKDLNPPAMNPAIWCDRTQQRRHSVKSIKSSSTFGSWCSTVVSVHDVEDLFEPVDLKTEMLLEAKGLLDDGLIDQAKYDSMCREIRGQSPAPVHDSAVSAEEGAGDGRPRQESVPVDLKTLELRRREATRKRPKSLPTRLWYLAGRPTGEEDGRLGYSERRRTGRRSMGVQRCVAKVSAIISAGQRFVCGRCSNGAWDKTGHVDLLNPQV